MFGRFGQVDEIFGPYEQRLRSLFMKFDIHARVLLVRRAQIRRIVSKKIAEKT